MTELVSALVVYTQGLFFYSRSGKLLWASTLSVNLVTLAVPYLPSGKKTGFIPLPAWVMLVPVAITGLYVFAAEIASEYFYT